MAIVKTSVSTLSPLFLNIAGALYVTLLIFVRGLIRSPVFETSVIKHNALKY